MVLHADAGQSETRPNASSLSWPRAALRSSRHYKQTIFAGTTALLLVLYLLVLAAEPAATTQTKSPAHSPASQVTVNSSSSTSPTGVTNQSVTSQQTISEGESSHNDSPSVHVTVNGQEIPVPKNGSTERTITSPEGTTSINVSASSTGDTSNNSFSSTNLNVFSSSSSVSSNSTLVIGGDSSQ